MPSESVVIVGLAPEAEFPVRDASPGTRLPARILDTDRPVSVVNRQTIGDRRTDDPQEAVPQAAGAVRAGSDHDRNQVTPKMFCGG